MLHEINFTLLLPGSLAKMSNQYGEFFHLTWKENQKTKTRYIRLDEVRRVRQGIKAYQKAKSTIEEAAKKNLKKLLKDRKSK